jgi:LacI family transcriptional regulator
MNKSPTIKDVAKKSGVSLGTASNALSGKVYVQPETAEKVQKAAMALGYQKNFSAQMLGLQKGKTKLRTGNLGLVFLGMNEAWSENPLALSYMAGVESVCTEAGLHFLVEYQSGDGSAPRLLTDGKVDGLVVKVSASAEKWLQNIPANIPIVVIGSHEQHLRVPVLSAHDESAGSEVTEYLWEKGHRRIAFITSSSNHPVFLNRYAGYEKFLKKQKSFDPALVAMEEPTSLTFAPEKSPPNLIGAVKKLFSLKVKPTAIVAANDWTASGLYASLRELGLEVPKDVSVVGFDNFGPLCEVMEPSLTSFEIPFLGLAQRATRLLIDHLKNPHLAPSPSVELLYGKLIERKSVRSLV